MTSRATCWCSPDITGMPYDRIAETLGIEVGAVKVRVHRAMKQLRAAFFQTRGCTMRCEEVRERFRGVSRRARSMRERREGTRAARLLVRRVPGRICRDRGAVEGAWRRADAAGALEPDARAVLRHAGGRTRVRGPTARIPSDRGRAWTPSCWPGEPLVQTGDGRIAPDRRRPGRPRVTMPQAGGRCGRNEIAEVRERTPRHAPDADAFADAAAVGDRAAARRELDGADRSAGQRNRLRAARHAAARPERQRAARGRSTRSAASAIAPTCGSGTKRAVADQYVAAAAGGGDRLHGGNTRPAGPALFRTLAQDTSLDESVRGRAQWGLEQFAS